MRETWHKNSPNRLKGLDRSQKMVIVDGHDPVPYDILSVDIGSRTLVVRTASGF